MKRIFAIVVAILAIPAIAFAAGLPDYAKDGNLAKTVSCDAGKTTAKEYKSPNGKWSAVEYRTAAGNVFVDFFSSDENESLHMKLAGAAEMKQVAHKDWDAALKAKSLNTFNYIHGGAHDCKVQ